MTFIDVSHRYGEGPEVLRRRLRGTMAASGGKGVRKASGSGLISNGYLLSPAEVKARVAG